MKKSLLVLILALTASFASDAQNLLSESQQAAADAAAAIQSTPKPEEKARNRYWNSSLQTKIDVGQTSLTNWSAGGNNTVSLKTFIDGNANYKKAEMFWNNRLQLDYGFLYSADKPIIQKTDDRIYLESKWGYQAKKSLYYSADFNFRSQFSNTYKYPTPSAKADGSELGEGEEYVHNDWKAARQLQSGLLSPAETRLALGLDYKPLNWLNVNLAPLTGGIVIVQDPLLRKAHGQPLKKEYENEELTDDQKKEGLVYRKTRFQFGAQLKVDFKVKVNDNFAFSSQVVLFSDYLNKPQNLKVNWDNRIDWKLAKFFSFTITTNLIYDDNVLIKNDKDIDKYPDGKKRIQFKESLSFGFVYTFATKS